MTARPKFLFDVDFSPRAAAEKPPETVTLAAHQAALTTARQQGYREGFAAAEAEARAAAQRSLGASLERIAAGITEFGRRLNETQAQLEVEGARIAVAVGRKLAATLIDNEPLAEISALAADCLRQLTGVPHVVVRINDAIYEQARDRLEALAKAQGFDGRLVILAAPEIPLGDCRIEWADGGVVRDSAEIETAIADAVERYVVSRLGGHLRTRAGQSHG